MEEIIKEEEKNNQQPQEKIEEEDDKNEENFINEKPEKQDKDKKEEKKEEKKIEENHVERQIEEDKNEKKHEEEKQVEPEKKIKEKIFIYFIGNYDENILSDFELDKSDLASDLEIISENNFLVDNNSYKYSIYRFKISKIKLDDKKKSKIKFKYKINNKNSETKIDIKDFNLDLDFDTFLYDIKLNSIVPQYYKFSDQETFIIYIKYLREIKLKLLHKSEENISLISSTLKFIITQKEYELSFYLLIFMECFYASISIKLIIEFDPNKVIRPGTITKFTTEQINRILNIYIRNIKNKLSLIENENDKMKFKVNCYTILLYFNYFFMKEKFILLLNDEQKRDVINPILLKHNIFKNIELSKEQIEKLINLASNFNELLIALSYNKDALIFLQIIQKNFDKISDLFKKQSSKTKKKLINMEEFIKPSDKDNLEEISKYYLNLLDSQLKSNNKIIFIIFGRTLFEKYIQTFKKENILYLFYLKKISLSIEKIVKTKDLDLDNIIHQSGLELSKNKQLENIEILEFINKEIKYKICSYSDKSSKSIEILNGLDVSTFNDEFYKKWKEINWNVIFGNQYNTFLEKIASMIKDMKNFKVLLKLFNLSNSDESNSFHSKAIKIMQEKYINLLENNYMPEDEDENEDIDEEKGKKNNTSSYNDLVELIFFSDKMKIDLEKFLKKLVNNFNADVINKVCLKLLEKNISSHMKDVITKFFIENANNADPLTLLQLIDNCPSIRFNILENFDKYVIKREEFFELEETPNIKLFKGLIERKLLENEFRPTEYIKNSIQLISSLQNEIEEGNIYYSEINLFYSNNKKDELKKKLLIISLDDDILASKLEQKIDDYINEVETIRKDLNLVYNDLRKYLYDEEKENIKILGDIIEKINTGYLNYCYEEKNKDQYQQLINTYKEKAQLRELMSTSLFFTNILENEKENSKKDIEIINQTENEFNKLKNIFTKQALSALSKETLDICINSIKGKKENEVIKEFDLLINIFKIDINSSECNKNDIIQSMITLSKKEDIYNIAKAISIFIDKIGAIKDVLYKKLEEIILNLKNSDIIKLEKFILEAIKILKQYNIDIGILYNEDYKDNNYINILMKLKEQPDSVQFLLERNIDDCRKLQELVGEMDNGFLSTNDVLDLEKCVEIMNKIGTIQTIKDMNDSDIVNSFIKTIGNYKNMEIYFAKYVNNYQELKNLFFYGLDKSEASKQKISLICHKSIFILKNVKNEFFNGKYYDDSNEDKENKDKKKIIENKIDMDSLLELRDRAQLTKKVKGDEEEKKILKNNKIFIKRVSEICNIHDFLHQIYMIGYPKEINIQINIKDFKSNFSGLGKNYRETISNLKKQLKELKKVQLEAYKNKPLIRFIYGRQFSMIYNYLSKAITIEKVSPFLKYLTNNLIKEENIDFNFNSKENLYEDLIYNIENYLDKILLKNNLTIEDIYKDSLIKAKGKGYDFRGLFLYLCNQSNQIDRDLFHIYKYLTENTPIAQTVLLCNKETTNEELVAFLYRAILCEFNSCFIIGGIELLEFDKKGKLLEILNILLSKDHTKMKSCLIVLYTSKDTDIYKSLDVLKYRKILNLPLKQIENLKINDGKTEIISSDESGVGKSTQIELQINSLNKNYVYFPFGGVFKREEVIERLKKLNIKNNSIIHLDLYDTDQNDLMMEFLFSILITKLYGQNEDIFYLSKEIGIKVEIPNGFIDFINKFPILKLFPNNKLLIKDLPPLIVPKDFLSNNIQIVANYLKEYNENNINNNDLYFENITPPEFEHYDTRVNAQILSQNACQKLIFEEIKKKINLPNYYQIKSFIDVLATQFKKFNQNFYLNAHIMRRIGNPDSLKIRSSIVESFIKITKHFIEGAFTKIVKKKKNNKMIFGEYNENKDNEEGIKDLSNTSHSVVSFNDIDPSLLFFHEGNGQLFSIITNKNRNDSEYKDLYNLKNYQVRNQNDYVDLPDYKNYTHLQFLNELKDILDVKNPVRKIDAREGALSLEEIAGNYVFTADNFVKMVIILLKIRAKIPVIMMGETGCGKTSLIRKLSEMINNGKCKMKIKNIHAGISDKDIINFINDEVIKEATELEKSEEEIRRKHEDVGEIYFPKKLWVFLDEINTCKSMGLISELMCKNKCQGEKLPNNIVFIAACNPYRHREKGLKEKAGLDVKQAYKEIKNLNPKEIEKMQKAINSTLVYTVNPLPHSLLNFVFDFGNLTPEDEKRYIESIISEPIERLYKNNQERDRNINEEEKRKIEENFKNMHALAKKMISKAQKFIRGKNGISSVSLREIRRFNIFYEFFYGYLKCKKEIDLNLLENNKMDNSDNEFYKNLNEIELHVYSIILGVFVCYYLRITDIKDRNEFRNLMNNVLKKFHSSFENKDFLDIPLKEELYIANNIDLESGIAKNRALLDNLFSLFIAINNKVPIFIVGKPGCSKSLSVQLINKAMKGSSSNNPLFKQFPKIILNSYQGSMGSTSQGVEKVFKKARKALENLSAEDKKNNISMIFFDEMGLAEHSPNNPLKVIHSELEYDLNEGDKKIAFVGISNWVLDASKMNRGMFLSIPEPEEDDTKETAFIIGKSYDEYLGELYKNLYQNLGITYFRYKKYLSENHSDDEKKDFHGNRDFYHLIKNAARNILEKSKEGKINNQTLLEISILSIERNFGGLQFNDDYNTTSLQVIKNIFRTLYPECNLNSKFNVLKRIEENILDLKSRYLLIISKSSISTFLLSSILSNLKKSYNLYIGSQFPNDIKSEEYPLKILNKIQMHMEQGNILVLKNLESVYPALYDLFNQNFTEVSKKNYARIAIGSSTNAFSFVNDNFRCIVNVDYTQIDDEEPPFLNRFEKQIITFENLLDKELLNESKKIFQILSELIIYDKNIMKGINYDLNKIFINFDLEEIQGIIYKARKISNINLEQIKDIVISKIALTLPQDILMCLKFNGFIKKYEEIANKIMKAYNSGSHNNINDFLKTMSNPKNIIYTFSGNLDIIKISNINIKYKSFGDINNKNIFEIKISSIKSENTLEKRIDDFFNDKEKKICLIRFNPSEGPFINYIKFFIENKEKDLSNKNEKVFIFIVHLVRIFNQDSPKEKQLSSEEEEEANKKILKETISHTSEYYQIFIDDLNGNKKFSLDEIILKNKRELLNKCLNLDEELKNNIYLALSYMDYKIHSEVCDLNEGNYINKLMDYISEDEDLRNLINECLLKDINDNDEDVIKEIFNKKDAVNPGDIDILSIIQKNLSRIYTKLLNIFYYKAEKDHFFSSLLSSYIENKYKTETEKITETRKITETDKIIEAINKSENNDSIKTIIEKTKLVYINNLKFNDGLLKVKEKTKQNKMEIFLGLKLPGLKVYIETFLQKLNKDNLRNYKRSEKNLREKESKEKKDNKENISNNEDKSNKENKEEIYKSKIKKYNESTLNEILNVDIFNEILRNIENQSGFYYLILDDYYTLFITKNLDKENGNKEKMIIEERYKNDDKNIFNITLLKKVLESIVLLRKEKEKQLENEEGLELLANTINWIESYSEEIIIILQVFSKLNRRIENLYEQIQETIKTIKEEDMLIEYNYKDSKAILYMIESILKVVTSNIQQYIDKKKDRSEFFQLLNTIKEILNQFLQININLKLYSKEVFSLQELMEIINFLYLNKKDQIENIIKVIQFFSKERILINSKKENEAVNELINLYNFLKDLVGDKENFSKLIALIFKNEYQKISKNTQYKLLNFILKDKNIIYHSYQLIKKVISIESTIEGMKNYLTNLKENHRLKESICAINSEFLDEIIINSYEYEINKFFGRCLNLKFDEKNKDDINKIYFKTLYENQDNKSKIFFDLPCVIFKECLEKLEYMLNNKQENGKLCKLFSITYIKIYLYKLVEKIFKSYDNMGNIKPIIDIVSKISSENLRKVIKIYIYKIIFNSLNRNWNETKSFNFKHYQLDIFNDLFENKNLEKKEFLTYCFLPLDSDNDYNKYFNKKNYFETKEKGKFENFISEFPQFINEKEFDIFLCLSINKILSNLVFKNYLEENPNYKNFLSLFNSLSSDNSESTYHENLFNIDLNKLLLLFFDIEKYNNKIRSKIVDKKDTINSELYEMLLYGFRFCVQTLKSEEDNFYSLIFDDNYSENLKKYCFPGNDYPDNLKLNSLVQIEKHLMDFTDDTGCYVCNCGFYYLIDPCGFPTKEKSFICPECQQGIGYGERVINIGAPNHGMVIRPGHYRIFKDLDQKKREMGKYGDCDENIPNRTLEQYKKEVIDPILKKFKYGINRIRKNIFIQKDKNIRNMSQITYRLLNFLLFNHLFYANCLDYISSKDLKNYLHENMSCLEIMKKDWDLLKEALEMKSITLIQIFLNLIFKRLSDLIKDCKPMTEEKDRDEFERKVENLVSKCIEEYPNYEKKYLEYNEKNLGLNTYGIQTIVGEIFQPIEEIYKHEDYPYLKYFTYTKYRTRDDLVNMLQQEKEYSKNYPLLYKYLQDNSKTKQLKYLQAFNEFTNYMVKYYSCQISRENAKKKILRDEAIMKEPNFSKKFKEFKNAWKNIKSYAIKYKCKDIMKQKNLDENDTLIYFLNDDGELGYGMYLAAACQNFIDWQNSFLKPIIHSEIHNTNIKYYIQNLKNKVPVQDALNEILLIDNFDKSEFNDFNDILYTFSRRNIFNKDGTINYLKYNLFKFDFSSIESELGEIILPGKCLFEDEDHLNFMTFWGEGFRGGKSETLSSFYLNYKQTDLTEDERKTILKYIKKRNKDGNSDFTEFFSSLNLLIFYLLNKRALSNEKISKILKEKPSYLKISEDCEEFFKNEGNEFEINKLMNIFFYIEHLCFNDLCNNLHPEFKKSINNETKEKIKKKLSNQNNKFYSIKDLAAALRRFVSRYLVGTRQDVEIDEKRELYFELTRLDLWEEKIGQIDNLEELIQNQLGEFKLKVGQALALYEIIGEEDRNYIKEIEHFYFEDSEANPKNGEESKRNEQSQLPEESGSQEDLQRREKSRIQEELKKKKNSDKDIKNYRNKKVEEEEPEDNSEDSGSSEDVEEMEERSMINQNNNTNSKYN